MHEAVTVTSAPFLGPLLSDVIIRIGNIDNQSIKKDSEEITGAKMIVGNILYANNSYTT